MVLALAGDSTITSLEEGLAAFFAVAFFAVVLAAVFLAAVFLVVVFFAEAFVTVFLSFSKASGISFAMETSTSLPCFTKSDWEVVFIFLKC